MNEDNDAPIDEMAETFFRQPRNTDPMLDELRDEIARQQPRPWGSLIAEDIAAEPIDLGVTFRPGFDLGTTMPGQIQYRVDWANVPMPTINEEGPLPEYGPTIPVYAYRDGVRIGDNAMPNYAPNYPETSAPTMDKPEIIEPRLYWRPAVHRFAINEYVRINQSFADFGSAYDDQDMGSPRTFSGIQQINAFKHCDSNADEYVALDNRNIYHPRHITYSPFTHCCGKPLVDNIPLNKRRFLRALWLIVAGQSSGVSFGFAQDSNHLHSIQFTADFENVMVHIHPLRGGPIPTTLAGIKKLKQAFLKSRMAIQAPNASAALDFAEKEKVLTAGRSYAVTEALKRASGNYDYAIQQAEDYESQYAVYKCRMVAMQEAMSLMSKSNIDFTPLVNTLEDMTSSCKSIKRDVDNKKALVARYTTELSIAKTAVANLTVPRSAFQALASLYENKIIQGYSFEKNKLMVLFNGFDMPIAPSPHCKFENSRCRCSIVVKGTIKIKPVIFYVHLDNNRLHWGVRKHKSTVMHPHFQSDGNYCLGGYDEAVQATLKSFDIGAFFMVMADYIHSFEVHSLLTNYESFDFVSSVPEDRRHGIFTRDPQECEEEGSECDNCGNTDCECD